MFRFICAVSLILVLSLGDPFLRAGFALENPGEDLKKVGVNSTLGAKIDSNLVFTDSSGTNKSLEQILANQLPTIIVPAYYGCPRLCGLLLSGVRDLINKLELNLGSEYQVATVSFDSTDTVRAAEKTEKKYRSGLKFDQQLSSNWRFYVGDNHNVSEFMRQIGFNFKRDGSEFAHSAAIIILTPEGQISQYFTGIEFSPWDVRMALIEAAHGSVGSALDHVFLFCFRFDPTKGKYTLAAFNVMKLGGAITLLFLVLLITRMYIKERALQ